jgi:hypothetical protein
LRIALLSHLANHLLRRRLQWSGPITAELLVGSGKGSTPPTLRLSLRVPELPILLDREQHHLRLAPAFHHHRVLLAHHLSD